MEISDDCFFVLLAFVPGARVDFEAPFGIAIRADLYKIVIADFVPRAAARV